MEETNKENKKKYVTIDTKCYEKKLNKLSIAV